MPPFIGLPQTCGHKDVSMHIRGGNCPFKAWRLLELSGLGSQAGNRGNQPTRLITWIMVSTKRSTAVTFSSRRAWSSPTKIYYKRT